jgi:hypothetical protein
MLFGFLWVYNGKNRFRRGLEWGIAVDQHTAPNGSALMGIAADGLRGGGTRHGGMGYPKGGGG